MRIEAPQHLPGTRSWLEEDLYQRLIIRRIELSSLCSEILLPLLFIQCGFVAIRKVLGELPLRESPPASVAVLAPTTAWWHTSNEPGSMRKKLSRGTPLVFITYWNLLLALDARGKRKEAHTIQIGVSAINIMVDSFLMAEELITLWELGQNVVHCFCQSKL